MSYLSAIIQLIIAIPKIYSIFKGLWDLIVSENQKTNKVEQQKAVEEMKKAQTEEEIRNANKRITSNLP